MRVDVQYGLGLRPVLAVDPLFEVGWLQRLGATEDQRFIGRVSYQHRRVVKFTLLIESVKIV